MDAARLTGFAESQRLAEFSLAVRQSTLKRLAAVPLHHARWCPAATAMSIADIAQHLIDADRWLFAKLRDPALAGMRGVAGAATLQNARDWDELLATLGELGRERSHRIAGMSAADLERSIPDDRFGGPVTAWWVVVRGNLDHEIHHRGQLATYLRILADSAAERPAREV